MDIEEVLRQHEPELIAETCEAIVGLEHYRRDGGDVTRDRVAALFRQLAAAVSSRDLREMRAYAERIARERYDTGFEAYEVESAFIALENAVWQHAMLSLPAYDQALGVGLACTALTHGRNAVGRAFEAALSRAPLPFLDLTALFRGTDAAVATRPAEELVYPA